MDAFTIAVFLSVFTNRVIDGFLAPIKSKFPDLDMWWMIYTAWVVGGLVGWLSGVNLLVDYIPSELVGRIMTAIVIGGGANLINDLFSQVVNVPLLMVEDENS